MSTGVGADMSSQEMMDFLHKLLTEGAKIQAAFNGVIKGLVATVQGVVTLAPDGTVWIVADPHTVGTAHISFDPSQVVSSRYGDTRVFGALAQKIKDNGGPGLSDVIVLVFADSSQLGLCVME